jgi:hypothetical protein
MQEAGPSVWSLITIERPSGEMPWSLLHLTAKPVSISARPGVPSRSTR